MPRHAPPGRGSTGGLYRRRYVDVADAGIPPLWHYLTNGRKEGRQAPAERLMVLPAAAQPAQVLPVAGAMPVVAETTAYDFAVMQRLLDDAQQARKDAVTPRRPAVALPADAHAALAEIAFPPDEAPLISVLVPAYNEFAHTVACLRSIAAAPPARAFEVVLADDASSDPDMARFAAVPNLRRLRQSRNLGFVRNCNAAFAACRGEYVLLLNNDAQLLPGALDALVDVLDERRQRGGGRAEDALSQRPPARGWLQRRPRRRKHHGGAVR